MPIVHVHQFNQSRSLHRILNLAYEEEKKNRYHCSAVIAIEIENKVTRHYFGRKQGKHEKINFAFLISFHLFPQRLDSIPNGWLK